MTGIYRSFSCPGVLPLSRDRVGNWRGALFLPGADVVLDMYFAGFGGRGLTELVIKSA